jgi:hypothetical protein
MFSSNPNGPAAKALSFCIPFGTAEAVPYKDLQQIAAEKSAQPRVAVLLKVDAS